MSGVGGVGGAMSVDRVMQLRSQILERNAALTRAQAAPEAAPTSEAKPTSFAATLETAFKDVNAAQNQAGELSAAYERGETIDIVALTPVP